MNLTELRHSLSKDSAFRRAEKKLGGLVALVLQIKAVRDESGISQLALAQKAGTSRSDVTRLENFNHLLDPLAVSRIVRALEQELTARGVAVAQWLVEEPVVFPAATPNIDPKTRDAVETTGRRNFQVILPLDRQQNRDESAV